MLILLALQALPVVPPAADAPRVADTLHLEVGSSEVDLSAMKPHDAKVIVERLVDGRWEAIAEWTNHLLVGDSAGRPVHRWTTIGTRPGAGGGTITWKLYQTFDKKSIAPLGYRRELADGGELSLVVEGSRIRGVSKAANGRTTPVDIQLSRAAFPAGASDLVPMGVALRDGLVMTVPVWQPGMQDVETRIFDVIGRREREVAGTRWNAWVVEERARRPTGIAFIGTWYIVEEPPYMVYADVEGPNGAKQRMTEVLLPSRR